MDKSVLNRTQLHPRYPILQIVPRGTFLKSIYVLHQYLDLYRWFFLQILFTDCYSRQIENFSFNHYITTHTFSK